MELLGWHPSTDVQIVHCRPLFHPKYLRTELPTVLSHWVTKAGFNQSPGSQHSMLGMWCWSTMQVQTHFGHNWPKSVKNVPKICPTHTMCPKYAQNVTKHTNCAQIVSKHLMFLWTLVSGHMNHVQTATTCPKITVNMPKLLGIFWSHFGPKC